MAEYDDIFAEGRKGYVPMLVAAAIMLIVAVSAYYYIASRPQAVVETSVITYPTTTYVPPPFGTNMSVQWVDISPSSPYAINSSYIRNSTSNYSLVQAIQYASPMFYGPGALTAYDSLIGNPQFEILANNAMPVNELALKYPNTILEVWAYAEPFNTTASAIAMFEYMSSTHQELNQSEASAIDPQIGSSSILLTYNSIQGELSPMTLYMVFFVKNSTFVQMGAWMPKNSTPDQVISIAREYAQNLP
ncbi:MAG: hypothetical protein KGH69_04855 [Candidatus Micrarchaeota archaeon]|nr:hypothetical protein [Candidatus Micrarchaeota archaeon]MDE1851985.1 hypothetical protein [Candidatus Micrarchaeota archaeon]